jgi:hypothetical protein
MPRLLDQDEQNMELNKEAYVDTEPLFWEIVYYIMTRPLWKMLTSLEKQ